MQPGRKKSFQEFVDAGEFPNLLLSGTAGLARALAWLEIAVHARSKWRGQPRRSSTTAPATPRLGPHLPHQKGTFASFILRYHIRI